MGFCDLARAFTGMWGIGIGIGIVKVFKQGYGDGSMAPGVLGIGTTAYISAHNQVNHSVGTNHTQMQ